MEKLRSRSQGGFTLIELLVVIAIIGILAAVVLVSLNSARVRGRDARRLSDLQQISLAMELYNDQNAGVYPDDGVGGVGTAPDAASFTTVVGVLVTSNLIPQVPADPLAGRVYVAQVNAETNPSSYILGADLEEDNQACDSDYDGTDVDGAGTTCNEVTSGDDNCEGDEVDLVDYCICQGPVCAS